MADYKKLNEINTTHFFLVSVNNSNGTFGYDDLFPTKEDYEAYIVEETHLIVSGALSCLNKGVIVVKEYNLTIKDVEWLMNNTQAFFDNISNFDDKCKIIETLNIGYE